MPNRAQRAHGLELSLKGKDALAIVAPANEEDVLPERVILVYPLPDE
jgi:hypothetical protein